MKKLNNAKWFTLGVALTLIVSLLVVPAVAQNLTKTAELTYRDIKITLDGQAITPKDANGNAVEPFIIDGTTYLPVRGVSGALGLDVAWDDATSTVALKSPGSGSSADPSGTVLVDMNGIKITYIGVSAASYSVEVKLLIENTTDKTYMVQARECSVNGFMVSPIFSPEIASGKKINASISFLNTYLEENGISLIENIELYFTIFESDNWSNDFQSPVITINCK